MKTRYLVFTSQLFLVLCFFIGFDFAYRWDSLSPSMKPSEIQSALFFMVLVCFVISILLSVPYLMGLILLKKFTRGETPFLLLSRFLLFMFFSIVNFAVLTLWLDKVLDTFDAGRQGRILSVVFVLVLMAGYGLAYRRFSNSSFRETDKTRLMAVLIFTFSITVLMMAFANIAAANHIGLRGVFNQYGLAAFLFYYWCFRKAINQFMDQSYAFIIPAGTILFFSFIPVCYLFATIESRDDMSFDIQQDTGVLETDVQNIILVTFDGLAANRMSLYGNPRITTPHFDALGEVSYVFDRMHSESDATVAGLTAIHSGIHYYSSRMQDYGSFIAGSNIIGFMPTVFKQLGWDAVYMLYGPNREAQNLFSVLAAYSDGPDHIRRRLFGPKPLVDLAKLHQEYPLIPGLWLQGIYLDHFGRHYSRLFPTRMVDASIENSTTPGGNKFSWAKEYLTNYRPENFFLWFHLYPPHQPYHRIPPYKGQFLDDPRNYGELLEELEFRTGPPLPLDKQGIADKLKLMYEEYLLALDAEFGKFLDFLEETGLDKQTMLIVSSDHGHAFAKGDMFHMSRVMYEQSVHIPLIIHMPDQQTEKRIDILAEHIDIMPTILEMLGVQQPDWMEGESLWRYMNSEVKISTTKAKFSQALPMQFELMESEAYKDLYTIVVYKNNHKLIYRFLGNGFLERISDENRLVTFFERFPEIELFDLSRDPEENDNIAQKEKQITDELMELVEGRIERIRRYRELSIQ